MNEKIKRLLQQIKGETYSPLGLSTIYGTSKLYGMTEEEITQFAELIVRACCDMLEQDAIQHEDDLWTSLASAVRDSKYKIQQYFEVK
jgi:hypothetical protein